MPKLLATIDKSIRESSTTLRFNRTVNNIFHLLSKRFRIELELAKIEVFSCVQILINVSYIFHTVFIRSISALFERIYNIDCFIIVIWIIFR